MEVAQAEGKINLLAHGEESGYTIFESADQTQIMHIGHPEYNATRLAYEAKRDEADPEVPAPVNFDFHNPKNRWRSHRNNFFIQWLRYCYLIVSTGDMTNAESLRGGRDKIT